jgi:hypothetical protein
LNANAATVLSMRGAVIAQVQFEQHQPLKLSPSTQINRLSINLLYSSSLPIRNVAWNP